MPIEDQDTIGTWVVETFGGPTLTARHCLRLLEEVVELCLAAGASPDDIYVAQENASAAGMKKSGQGYMEGRSQPGKVSEELADCNVILLSLAHRAIIDLGQATDEKMKINRARKWNLKGDGTGYHIPED